MHFESLPTEIVTHIFLSLKDIASVNALASACHRFNNIFNSSKRLLILLEAADAEYGPVEDILQLLTQNASQPAHLRRQVPVSEALLQQVVKTGRIAQRYEDIYPLKKWKHDYANRRLLTELERHNLRRALYRLWLYTRAFHNQSHMRTTRAIPNVVRERAALLQNFTTSELAEMHDAHILLRDLVANNICPSNGKMRHRFRKRHPEPTHYNHHHPLLVNIHLNYPPPPFSAATTFADRYHNKSSSGQRYSHLLSSASACLALDPSGSAEGWGDDITHYYVVEDMLKLSPETILFLKDAGLPRVDVESFVKGLGEWFGNNGETFAETCMAVLCGRGVEWEDFRAEVEEGGLGVVVVRDEEEDEGF
jgi:hypothetical protein